MCQISFGKMASNFIVALSGRGVHLDPPKPLIWTPPILGGEREARGGERGGPNEWLWDRGARWGERGQEGARVGGRGREGGERGTEGQRKFSPGIRPFRVGGGEHSWNQEELLVITRPVIDHHFPNYFPILSHQKPLVLMVDTIPLYMLLSSVNHP